MGGPWTSFLLMFTYNGLIGDRRLCNLAGTNARSRRRPAGGASSPAPGRTGSVGAGVPPPVPSRSEEDGDAARRQDRLHGFPGASFATRNRAAAARRRGVEVAGGGPAGGGPAGGGARRVARARGGRGAGEQCGAGGCHDVLRIRQPRHGAELHRRHADLRLSVDQRRNTVGGHRAGHRKHPAHCQDSFGVGDRNRGRDAGGGRRRWARDPRTSSMPPRAA